MPPRDTNVAADLKNRSGSSRDELFFRCYVILRTCSACFGAQLSLYFIFFQLHNHLARSYTLTLHFIRRFHKHEMSQGKSVLCLFSIVAVTMVLGFITGTSSVPTTFLVLQVRASYSRSHQYISFLAACCSCLGMGRPLRTHQAVWILLGAVVAFGELALAAGE